MISHCFAKIAACDDGNFILPLHEAEAREGRGERRGRERGREVRRDVWNNAEGKGGSCSEFERRTFEEMANDGRKRDDLTRLMKEDRIKGRKGKMNDGGLGGQGEGAKICEGRKQCKERR